jgi:Fe-S cluster assembly ATP-binding protein
VNPVLEIKDLRVSIEDKLILKGVNLTIQKDEIHAIMGPNGSGKSTLSYVLMGHPKYKYEGGDILFLGESILNLPTEERAKLGMFLSFQYPTSLPGVTTNHFLKTMIRSLHGKDLLIKEYRSKVTSNMKTLGMKEEFLTRYVNEGFSGGEKKRNEILQYSLAEPKLAILDETDSGLDIDALRIVSQGINQFRKPGSSILLITHYQRMLNYIQPDFVHVFADGKILKTGTKDLALELEEKGYDWILSP